MPPFVLREVVYRIFLGEQRDRLREIPAIGASEQRMSKAIELIRNNYDKPLYITRLARKFGMSPPGFHHHFKREARHEAVRSALPNMKIADACHPVRSVERSPAGRRWSGGANIPHSATNGNW